MTLQSMMCGGTVAGPTRILAFTLIIDKLKVDVVVLGLSANTEPPSLDSRKNNANELSERGRVEGDDAICTAALCIL